MYLSVKWSPTFSKKHLSLSRHNPIEGWLDVWCLLTRGFIRGWYSSSVNPETFFSFPDIIHWFIHPLSRDSWLYSQLFDLLSVGHIAGLAQDFGKWHQYHGLALSHQGWGLLSQLPPFRYFPNFGVLSKHTLSIEDHVYIWQVSPQISCGGTCQI